MTKVAIIIPTMNRPDFILRQFEFYEQMNSPHPVYISDSSNPENTEKLKEKIKKFKNFSITYQWAPPGKDCLYQILPLVKEKYCIQMGDDDIMIPKTISECADFLENHSDYGTCAGKQVNIRLQKEDYNKPYGLIERQTIAFSESIEIEDMPARVKKFWSKPPYFSFVVARTETERSMRNITKHFSLVSRMTEFLLTSTRIVSGKFKMLDKLGYIMQISDRRYDFEHNSYLNFILSPNFKGEWKICEEGFSEIIQRVGGRSKAENQKIAQWILVLYLAHQFALEATDLPITNWKKTAPGRSVRRFLLTKLKYLFSNNALFKKIYYQFNSSDELTRPESKYFKDFKTVKDFLEA